MVHTYFGEDVVDDYEWLEDAESADVRAFTDAQNALARSTLDALSERNAVQSRVASIYGAASADWFALQPRGARIFALKSAPPKQQPILVELGMARTSSATPIDPASERVVVDPNVLDPSGKTTIDFFVPSPDGRLVAVSLSKDGSESGDLHIFDVASGKERASEVIPRVQGGTAGGSVAWNADGSGLHYTRYPRSGERPPADLDFYQQVWFHKLGTPESADTFALGKELPRIAEVELLRSHDGKRTLALVYNGDGGEVEHHVFDNGKWLRLSTFEDELSAATFGADGKIYAVSRKDAPRGKVIAFAPPFERPSKIDVLPESDAVIEYVLATKNALYVVETADGPSRLRRFPLDTKPEPLARELQTTQPKREKSGKKRTPPAPPPPPIVLTPGARGPAAALLPLPPVSSVNGAIAVGAGDDLLLRVESFVEAPRWMFYRANEHRLVTTSLTKKAAFDMADVEVVRETCVSKDGTKVPMSVLRKRDTKRDGSGHALLTGYGGFGVTQAADARDPSRVARQRRCRRRGEPARGRGARRDVASCRQPHEQTKRVRRLRGLRQGAGGARVHEAGATRDQRSFERRSADGRVARSTPGALPRRRLRGRHLRHAPDGAEPEWRLQRDRIRHGEGRGAVPSAAGLFAAAQRQGRYGLSRGPLHDGRE